MEMSRQQVEQGLKSKLRRIRYAKTKQKKLLAKVGLEYNLIDNSWLENAFRKNIIDLETQEEDILEKLHDLNEPPEN